MRTIELIGTEKEQSDTYYFLITNGVTYSYKHKQIIIEDDVYRKLKKAGLKFGEVNK